MFSGEFETIESALHTAINVLASTSDTDADSSRAYDKLVAAQGELEYIRDNIAVDTDRISDELEHVERKVEELHELSNVLARYVEDVRSEL